MTHPTRTVSLIVRTINLVLIGLLTMILLIACSEKEPGESDASGKTISQSQSGTPPVLKEALAIFRAQGLFFEGTIPAAVKDPAALNRFLKDNDPSAVFLTPEAFAAFQVSHKANYAGVGMEIERRESGEIVCFPMPGSPAQKAGIEKGDRIEAIDGQPAAGRSVYVVASWLMGVGGTRVSIRIAKKSGDRQRVDVIREPIQTHSVTVESKSGLTIVKIHYFDSGTRRQMQYLLEELTPGTRLVLDLRDNPGGDLYKSIDAAMLFLEKGALITTIQSRNTDHPYRSTTAAFYSASPLLIWQNENTASAAEVFIAALTENGRAVSIGTTTYGKGTTQEVAEMSDGSAIVFTSGYLLTPKGRRYHQRGLMPSSALKSSAASNSVFLKESERIIKDH